MTNNIQLQTSIKRRQALIVRDCLKRFRDQNLQDIGQMTVHGDDGTIAALVNGVKHLDLVMQSITEQFASESRFVKISREELAVIDNALDVLQYDPLATDPEYRDVHDMIMDQMEGIWEIEDEQNDR